MYTLYCYSKCSTCKKAIKYLNEKGIKYKSIDLSEKTLSLEELLSLYKSGKYPLKKFFNTSGLVYRNLNLKEKLKEMDETEALELLSKEGMLLKRPFLLTKNDFLIGFKEEEWNNSIK